MDRVIVWICFVCFSQAILRATNTPDLVAKASYRIPQKPPACLAFVNLAVPLSRLVLTATTPLPPRSPFEWSLLPALRALLDQSVEVCLQVEVRAHWILVDCFPRKLPFSVS
jgi:hypothetical protein